MPDAETIRIIAQLGGTVFVVCVFVGYLVHKNGKSEKAMQRVADSLKTVNDAQEVHTRVLMRIAQQHGLSGDADDLMTGRR
jgi:CHASE3 domain sensor protein